MEKIEIYSSKKKSILLLAGSLLFVIGGIYTFVNAEDFDGFRGRNPLFIKVIGIAAIFFFGLGIFVSIKQLFINQLILTIDRNGINVNPKNSKTEFIEWKNITGFSEIKIHGQKFVIIEVNNSDYWIEKELNGIRKNLMKFNLNNYGSPFNLSANTMQINYTELLKTLNENFEKSKYNA